MCAYNIYIYIYAHTYRGPSPGVVGPGRLLRAAPRLHGPYIYIYIYREREMYM